MKKILFSIIAFIFLFIFSACMIGPGLTNSDVQLIGNYDLIKTNRNTIFIGRRSDVGWEEVIPPKVVKLGYDQRYILVVVQLTEYDSLNFNLDEEKWKYFVIDTVEDEINEVSEISGNLNYIDLKNVDCYFD